MARPKLIEDRVLLDLIKKYYDEECNNNAKKLKATEVTKYINKNGYPDYPVTTLRRTKIAMEYIEKLIKLCRDDDYVTLVSYQTVDAEALVEANRTKESLIKAIYERDCYYKKVADSAVHFLDMHNELNQQLEDEKKKTEILTVKIKGLESLVAQYKTEIKTLKAERKAYETVVNTYVYPELANELLTKEGALRKTKTPLIEGSLENNLITSTTNAKKKAKSGSSIISGLFDVLED